MGIFRRAKERKPLSPKVVVVFLVLFFAAFAYLKWQQNAGQQADVWVGDTYVSAEVADTFQKRTQGLSGRTRLKNGEGMLFVFPQREQQVFWMKGMYIPIDIVWIDGKTIVDIAPEVPPPPTPDTPPQELKRYVPRAPATAVLEVPAGFAMAHQWKIGDPVVLQFDK